jgi:hypothetical protein
VFSFSIDLNIIRSKMTNNLTFFIDRIFPIFQRLSIDIKKTAYFYQQDVIRYHDQVAASIMKFITAP